MLQTLQNELTTLQTNSKQQDQRLENLYMSFQEIYDLKKKLDNPSSTMHNMLNYVRPDIFHQIFIFLDTKQIFRFRLVSKKANYVVKLMLPKQIFIFQQQIADQQNEIQLKIQDIQGIGEDQSQQQVMKAAIDGVSRLTKNHIVELKSLARPPELVEKIINLVCMTLDPTFKIQKDNWKECQKYLSRVNFLELIATLDISSINDKQLQQLEQVNSIQEQQAAAMSTVAKFILIFLKAVFEIRQSKLYMTQNAIKQLESKIMKEEQLIKKFEKIIK
ncbi:unnamed protein product [Paramecium pentaurelia]|uniref:F-box domain-containing protein n=1 Tax=Paramecium pentaurelia TaxID=43138 RepID=A0A8S1XQ47_9CILI|nr:unnamed protein product [Paramecium pentaurelia]